MFYKKASLEEIKEIYKNHMLEDFPPAELKPLEAIKHAVTKGRYQVFAACEGEEILGYACVADCGGEIGFLDYFAIVKKYRGTGIGTEFFRELKALTDFDFIILETESIESAENEEQDFTRERRIAFYKRSGCVDTGCMYNVFGVEYNIFINRSISLDEDVISRLLSAYEYAYAAILRRDDKNYIYRVK